MKFQKILPLYFFFNLRDKTLLCIRQLEITFFAKPHFMENELYWSKSICKMRFNQMTSKQCLWFANSKISWVWKSEMHKSKSVLLLEERPTQGKNFLVVYLPLSDLRWLKFYMTLKKGSFCQLLWLTPNITEISVCIPVFSTYIFHFRLLNYGPTPYNCPA